MTYEEFSNKYMDLSKKELTSGFNNLSIDDREIFLEMLPEEQYSKFISDIRTQAVKDFWTHEQALIKEGKCTRDWTPNQIEDILNISEKTGVMSINGEAAVDLDGKKYYGHHMKNVSDHPEYAGDWRNIEALDYNEHFVGAHAGNTKSPTDAYYNPDTKENIPIDITKFESSADVKTGQGYIPTKDCIFKSDRDINLIYSRHGNINDGERLALKNIEYSKTPKGTITDYERGLKIAEKYKCEGFKNKFGMNSSPLEMLNNNTYVANKSAYGSMEKKKIKVDNNTSNPAKIMPRRCVRLK